MKPLRAASCSIALGSFLVWLYCVQRIFFGEFPFSDLFIDGIPITFLQLSIGAFLIFMTTFFSYLVLEDT